MNFHQAFRDTAPGANNSDTAEGGWRHAGLDLVRDNKGRPLWNMANAVEVLTHHAEWAGVLAYNTFRDRREVLRPLPGNAGAPVPRDLGDDDYTAALQWLNRNGFPQATMTVVIPAMRAACRASTYDSLTEHLDRLHWDGTERLSTWLLDYCGAAVDDEYTREVGRRWLISAIARAYKPGCKADCMLVLEGAQGAGKSTALRILASEPFFGDGLPPMGTKDASSYLRGKWIVEVAELEAMRREVDTIKAFLSRQAEDFRRAYGREEEAFPRRCVFAGTTNKADWHRDETGGRRFWPVVCGEIDTKSLERDRDQLWAEAIVAFKRGERWWLQDDVEQQAAALIAERAPDDPWTCAVADFLDGCSEVCARQVLVSLGVETPDMTPVQSKRVASVLLDLGWQRAGKFTRDPFKGQARFVPPVRQR